MLTTEQRLRMMETPQTTFDLVIDTDAYNEIDDQFAISYALRAQDRLHLLALCAAAAARFSQAQRRGKFSIAPIAALALTIGGFFPRMGAASTFIWAFVAAAGAGLCVVLLQKGETEDAEKQDFRVRQDA